ncbi:MAG: ABC transporter permease, partial [Saprospiraceae bacterium]|nr:ABC transporter permease [Saprospiraceae bacterium]
LNALTLACGLAVTLLIGLFIASELSYDQWIPGHEQVHRVYRDWGGDSKVVWTPSLLAQKLVTDYPEVNRATGLAPQGELLIEKGENRFYIQKTADVDSTFFQIVGFPFVAGDSKTALQDPKAVVITARLARRIFGDEDAMGQSIRLDGDDDYFVNGIIAVDGKNTHLPFDLYQRFGWYSPYWSGNNRATYVSLRQHASVSTLEEKMTVDVNQLIKNEMEEMNYNITAEDLAQWRLQPMDKVHLYSNELSWIKDKRGNIDHLFIYGLIAILVLIVAIFNYINLSTSQAAQRGREVGVRKVTGALRSQLMVQFISESVLIAVIAGALAVVLASLLLPIFNNITDRTLNLSSQGWYWLPVLFLISIATGIAAGFYPALVMSGYRPVEAIQSKFFGIRNKGWLRKILVTSQFTITIALLFIMAFIYRQIYFMTQHDLGFHPEQVITIPLNYSTTSAKVQARKQDLLSIPGVESVTTSSRLPGKLIPDWGARIQGREDGYNPYVLFTDPDFISTMDLEMIKGRYFNEAIAGDTIENFVVNEAFIRDFQIDDPIGVRIKFTSDTTWGQIIGVVKNFNFHSLSAPIRPLLMGSMENKWFASIKTSSTDLNQVIVQIKAKWQQIEPTHPMRYSFLDEDFAALYAEQKRFGNTVFYSGLLTLVIALLGLFGLTMFSVQRRIKEIGIRKILGASVIGIIQLISIDFIKLILIAFLVALPIGYLLTRRWLEGFAYQTNLTWWVFGAVGLVIVLVSMLTVSAQSLRAAYAKPVSSLRME